MTPASIHYLPTRVFRVAPVDPEVNWAPTYFADSSSALDLAFSLTRSLGVAVELADAETVLREAPVSTLPSRVTPPTGRWTRWTQLLPIVCGICPGCLSSGGCQSPAGVILEPLRGEGAR